MLTCDAGTASPIQREEVNAMAEKGKQPKRKAQPKRKPAKPKAKKKPDKGRTYG